MANAEDPASSSGGSSMVSRPDTGDVIGRSVLELNSRCSVLADPPLPERFERYIFGSAGDVTGREADPRVKANASGASVTME